MIKPSIHSETGHIDILGKILSNPCGEISLDKVKQCELILEDDKRRRKLSTFMSENFLHIFKAENKDNEI